MSTDLEAFYTPHLAIPYSNTSTLNKADIYLPHAPSSQPGSTTSGTTTTATATATGTTSPPTTKYWIIYLHGGAWRDPQQTRRTLIPALSHLDPSAHPIAGIASLDYRLSPHPSFPSEPGSDDETSRSATHPDHLRDVLDGIAFLQARYGFGSKYLLCGHSAGGTLAFQAVVAKGMGAGGGGAGVADPARPEGVLGVCGIYDLRLLGQTHESVPAYREFLEAAFGEDRRGWDAASPVAGRLSRDWAEGRVAVLAPSRDDELVDFVQAEAMSGYLWRERSGGRRDVLIALDGRHEQVWAEGRELARAIKKALHMLTDTRDEDRVR